MNIPTFGIVILGGLLALWLLGGVLLRISGLLLALAGGFGIGLQHDANGLFVLAIGALLCTGTTRFDTTNTKAR